MKKEDLSVADCMADRILVLDGGMGTLLQAHKFEETDFRGEQFSEWPSPLKGNNDLLSITQPDAVAEVHRAYFAAGSDIIETNTFSSTSIAQADYGLEEWAYELNRQSAALARAVADEFTAKNPLKPRFVAGSIGPTNKTASLSPDVERPEFRAVHFDELKEAYREQARGLLDGGVDLLLVETVFDTLNAKAALFGIEEELESRGQRLPVMVSGTITDASGRTLSGQTPEAFWISLKHADLFSIGFNCALGAKQLRPYIEVLASRANCAISVHPNAGLPNAFGEYDQGPEDMALEIKEYLERGLVNIVGGCCGTNPDHIRALSELTAQYAPRVIQDEPFKSVAQG